MQSSHLGCRIRWLQLWRWVIHLPHPNECTIYYANSLNTHESNLAAWRNVEYSFIAITSVLYSHAYTSTYTHAYTCRMDHNDTITKTSEDFFKKNIPLTLFVTFACERELETEQRLQYIVPSILWPSGLCLSRSTGLLNRRPRGPLCWVRAFSTTSWLRLLWFPTHGHPGFTELYNSSIAHSIFRMACLTVIERK